MVELTGCTLKVSRLVELCFLVVVQCRVVPVETVGPLVKPEVAD